LPLRGLELTMKQIAKWLLAALVLSVLVVPTACLRGSEMKVIPLFIGDLKFTVEVADTDEKWTTGLMYREYIADDFGMLFVSRDEEYHSFWMKNCKIHLDIIFLDRNKQVINIHADVPPCTYTPCPSYPSDRPAMYVLELRGKRAQEINLKPGDVISFNWKF